MIGKIDRCQQLPAIVAIQMRVFTKPVHFWKLVHSGEHVECRKKKLRDWINTLRDYRKSRKENRKTI